MLASYFINTKCDAAPRKLDGLKPSSSSPPATEMNKHRDPQNPISRASALPCSRSLSESAPKIFGTGQRMSLQKILIVILATLGSALPAQTAKPETRHYTC